MHKDWGCEQSDVSTGIVFEVENIVKMKSGVEKEEKRYGTPEELTFRDLME